MVKTALDFGFKKNPKEKRKKGQWGRKNPWIGKLGSRERLIDKFYLVNYFGLKTTSRMCEARMGHWTTV